MNQIASWLNAHTIFDYTLRGKEVPGNVILDFRSTIFRFFVCNKIFNLGTWVRQGEVKRQDESR